MTQEPVTSGMYLRQLREERRISIDDLARWSQTTFRTLQKIETGKTLRPSRELLLRFLNELSAVVRLSSLERNRLLEPFGYRDQSPQPEAGEILRITEQWEKEAFELPHPACLVDCAHRIHAWNRYTPKMLGLEFGHPFMEHFRGKTLFDVLFDKSFSPAFTIPNKEGFVYEMLETMRSEFEPFKDEEWCQQCIQEAKIKYSEFRKHWEAMEKKPVRQLSLRMLGPIHMHPKEETQLHFYLLGTDFLSDSRFRVIQYLPADAATMRHCLSWIEEANL